MRRDLSSCLLIRVLKTRMANEIHVWLLFWVLFSMDSNAVLSLCPARAPAHSLACNQNDCSSSKGSIKHKFIEVTPAHDHTRICLLL